ncbi:MAG: HEAT repeat domain-containing protein [Chloroflexi bacterium]|nr:HEAT repeat domain-containing protein [Chloroflexota bacterium]
MSNQSQQHNQDDMEEREEAIIGLVNRILDGDFLGDTSTMLIILRDAFVKAQRVTLLRVQKRMDELRQSYQEHPYPYIIFVLATLGDKSVYHELERMIMEEQYDRATALEVIGYLGEMRAMPILLEWLQKGNDYEVEVAARSIRELRHPAAVPGLTAKLTLDNWNRSSWMVANIERALKAIGTPEAIEALVHWEQQKP